tara:strand:+ start:486 stop:1454 length:969 start_codon:yes stop_codon:yes gene_type:complete
MNFKKYKISKIKGDASFREFFRKNENKKNSIIIYSKKEKKKNLLDYDAINKILDLNKIPSPKLIKHEYNHNFIEVQDLGKKTVLDTIKNKKDKIKIFKKIIKLLLRIQKIQNKKIKNFKNKYYRLPIYSRKILFKEANLFCDWYVPYNISKKKKSYINRKLKIKINSLLSSLRQKNNTFVHRDFHVSNLMFKNKNLALIDSQDAMIGNKAYDLASLIDDVRLKTSQQTKSEIYNFYLRCNKKEINVFKFKNDFEILSVLRNLKIIGIFTRLAVRDKKTNYLKLIPYTWKLIDLRCNNNNLLKDLKFFLDQNFTKKIRNKYAN